MAVNFDDLDDLDDFDIPSTKTRGTAATESSAQETSGVPSADETGSSPSDPDALGPSGMPESLPDDAYTDDANREPAAFNWHADADRAIAQDNDWPAPLDLTRSVYKGLPLDLKLIPAALRPIVSDCSRRTGIDPGAYFLGFLGACSGLANDNIKLQPKLLDTRWTVRPVIWPFAIGGSSSGKSPALEEGMHFLIKKDTEAMLDNARLRKEYEHAKNLYDDRVAEARKAKNPVMPMDEPPLPEYRQYWVSRGTTEGVTRLLETSRKVTWYMDEASGMINGWDRYASGGKGSGDREFVLMLWNGGRGKNTLAGKDIVLENASAVLCGGSTPIAMRICAGGKLQNDGFLQRTLLCMVRRKASGLDATPNAQAYEQYERIIDTLLEMHGTALVKMSPDAYRVYQDFVIKTGLRIEHEENESLASHLGKHEGLAPRLMLLYYMIERASMGQLIGSNDLISADIARQVCALLSDWQLSHLQEFWGEVMEGKPARGFAQIIANYILANDDKDTLNHRNDITKPHWLAWTKLQPNERKEAIMTLVNCAWLTPQGEKRNAEGLPNSYSVNPKIRSMFAQQAAEEREVRDLKRTELQRMRGQPEVSDC